jgi:tetratricopeptide (TPR) repeat protein
MRQQSERESGGGANAALDARLAEAVAQFRAGRVAEAERACRDILTSAPAYVPAAVLCAQAMSQRGEVMGGIELLQKALEIRPRSVPALNGLAVLSLRAGLLEAAKGACQRCLAVDPLNLVAFFTLGQIADAAGRPADAAAAYSRACEINPGFTNALAPLAFALQKLGRTEEAAAAYRRVPAGDKSEFTAQFNLGLLLQGEGKLPEAAAAFARAAAVNPADLAPLFQLGAVHYAGGRYDEAIDCYRRLLLQKPDMAGAHGNLAKALWATDDAPGALAVCDDGLRQRPGDTAIIAFKAALLQETGQGDAARRLVDFDRLLRPVRIVAPAGYASIAEFNAAMGAFALQHPTLVYEPRNHATKNGRHTGELMTQPKGPVIAFAESVKAAVARYMQEVPPDPAHPFAAHPPARWRLSAWAVVMEGQGHQTPHIHPQAWLSGVYYASVPPDIADGGGKAGWIEFGEPLPEYRFKEPPELRIIKPEEGLMLLFPSYFFHRTLPFSATGTRISIAFDVVPQ